MVVGTPQTEAFDGDVRPELINLYQTCDFPCSFLRPERKIYTPLQSFKINIRTAANQNWLHLNKDLIRGNVDMEEIIPCKQNARWVKSQSENDQILYPFSG